MVTRYSSSLAFAGLVTFALLYLMQQMIATGRPVLNGESPLRLLPFTIVERSPPEIRTRPPRQAPTDPAEPPPRPRVTADPTGELTVSTRYPQAPAIGSFIPERSSLVDGDVLPIVKVRPNYPPTAISRGLEGHVVVEFTVTAAGSVTDVVVVESTHPVFERAAVEAARKFRYRPRVIGGTPVQVRGVRNLMTFRLD